MIGAFQAGVLGIPKNVPAYLLLDSFTGSDDTPLTSHTPEIGGPWLNGRGTARIFNNGVQAVTFSGSVCNPVVETSAADVYISSLVNINIQSGLTFRYLDANNFWFLWQNGTTSLWIYEVVTGSFFTRATIVGSFIDPSSGVLLEVMCYGDSIKCKRSSISSGLTNAVAFTSTSGATRTKHGLYTQTTGMLFHDIACKQSTGAEI